MSQGHLHGDLLRSSPEKVRWLHKLAVMRLARQTADFDYRHMQAVHLAVASQISKKGDAAYRKTLNALKAIAEAPSKQDPATNRRRVVSSLVKLGASAQAA